MNPENPTPSPQPTDPNQPQAVGSQPQVVMPAQPTTLIQPPATVSGVEPLAVQPSQNAWSAPGPSVTSTRSSGRKVILIIGIVIIIALTGASALLLTHKESPSQSSGNGSVNPASSSTGSRSKTYPSKTACELFTLADAQSILGPNAQANNSSPAPASASNFTSSLCVYNADLHKADDVSLVLISYEAKDTATAQKIYSGYQKIDAAYTSDNLNVQAVNNLGDAAFSTKNGDGGYMVLIGNYVINLSGNHGDGGTSGLQPQLLKAAQTIVANLQKS